MSNIVIYGASLSPFVRKVRVVCAEKGLDYTNENAAPGFLPDELKPHSPLGKIPFANIDGRWLSDSSVIVAYLEKLHPTPPVLPSDPWDYARALWFEEFIDGGAAMKLGPSIYFERVIAPMFFGREPDEAKASEAQTKVLPGIYEYLDGEIGEKKFLVADTCTLADITVGCFFVDMNRADAAPDPAIYPNLARYIGKQHARPSLKALIEEDDERIAAKS